MSSRPKVTVKITYNAASTSNPPSRTNSPRPPSPIKRTESNSTTSTTSTTFKPRAKVNSSATIRKSPSVVSVTPRAGSPTKETRLNTSTLAPTFKPRVPSSTTTPTATTPKVPSLRPQTPVSVPSTPDLRQRYAQSEVGKNPTVAARQQGGGGPLHHAMSFSSLPTAAQKEDNESKPSSPTLRIRAKVSNLSRLGPDNRPSSPSLQPSSARVPPVRLRSPSASSSVSQMSNRDTTFNPPSQLYTASQAGSPATTPSRFNPARPTSSIVNGSMYQAPGLANETTTSNGPNAKPPNPPHPSVRPRVGGAAKVDINSIPCPPPPQPPVSPPSSSLSFSSRSSGVSVSSSGTDALPLRRSPSPFLTATELSAEKRRESGATEIFRPMPIAAHVNAEPQRVDEDSELETGLKLEEEDSEVKVKAAAKTNRKIADLEITNRSLLSINASLEATKNKQAKEIRELRRKLRESRLILPPRAYLAVQAKDGDDLEDDTDSEIEDAAEGNGDEIYQRVKLMLEGLLTSGKKALETKVADLDVGKKVLTAEEVQSWHRSNNNDIDGYSEFESEMDSMSMSHADTSLASSVNGDEDEEDDGNEAAAAFFTNGPFFKGQTSHGPPIHVSEA